MLLKYCPIFVHIFSVLIEVMNSFKILHRKCQPWRLLQGNPSHKMFSRIFFFILLRIFTFLFPPIPKLNDVLKCLINNKIQFNIILFFPLLFNYSIFILSISFISAFFFLHYLHHTIWNAPKQWFYILCISLF